MSTIADQLYKAAESAAAMAGGADEPSAGGPFQTSPIVDQPARRNYGIPSGGARSYADQPQMGGGYMVPAENLPTAGLPQLMSQDRAAIDFAQAVQQRGMAAQPAGAAAVTPQGTTTATTGAAPGQEAPEEQRRRGRSSWEAPGEAVQFTQEDFYPNPQDPFAGQYSTGIEYVARQGRMPMGALSKAAAALQDRQLQLDQKRQEFIDDLYKPIKTATPYQQNFNVIVNKQREDFVKSVADAYTNGDVNKAYRQIYSSPQLRNQWRQINADLEALGQRGGEIFARAEKYLADAATNTIGSTPEMRKLARDIMYGMGGYASPDGTGGDFNTLIKNIKQFEMMEGRDRYFRDTVTKSVKDFAERLPYTADGQKPYVITPEKRYRFITQGHRQTFINQIKQIARDMAVYQGYGEGADLTARIADNEKFLMAMLPDQYDLNTTVEDTYANISRGGGAGDTGMKINYGYNLLNRTPSLEKAGENLYWMTVAREKGANIGSESGEDSRGRRIGIDEIVLMGETSGEPRALKPKTINNQNVIPVGVFRDYDGKMWLRGKIAGEPGVKSIEGTGKDKKTTYYSPEDLKKITSTDPQTGETVYMDFKILKDVVIPFTETSGDIETAIGMTAGQASQFIDMRRSQKGFGQRTAVGRISEEEFNRKWAALPSGGKLIGPDGQEYTKK